MSKNISENFFLTGVHLQLSNFQKRQRQESCLSTFSAILKYLKNLRSRFDNFSPILKNTLFGKSDIGYLMKNYVAEERLLSQPRKC